MQVWCDVDGATVDRFLFHQPSAAVLNRQIWRESGPANTGAPERALGRQSIRPVPLFNDLHRIRVPTLVLVGLHNRNVGA